MQVVQYLLCRLWSVCVSRWCTFSHCSDNKLKRIYSRNITNLVTVMVSCTEHR